MIRVGTVKLMGFVFGFGVILGAILMASSDCLGV